MNIGLPICAALLLPLPLVFSKATSQPVEAHSEHRKVLEKWCAMWRSKDASLADEIMSDQLVRFHPRDLEVDSRADFKAYMTTLLQSFPDFAIDVHEIDVCERGGRVRWTATGTNTGTGYHPPTGRRMELTGSDFMVIEDGRIICNWASWEQNDLLAQLGAEPVLPQAHRNKETMLRWPQEILNQGRYETVAEVFTASHVFDENGNLYNGHAGVRGHAAALRAAFAGFRLEITDAQATSERGAARWTATGKHTGEFLGIPATGRDVTVHGLMVVRFESGKVKKSFCSWDTSALFRQLGVTGPSLPAAKPADAASGR